MYYFLLFCTQKKADIKLTCLLLAMVDAFVVFTDVIFDVSIVVIPPPTHGAVDLNAEDALEAD